MDVPAIAKIAFTSEDSGPHLSTKTDARLGGWARAHNVELAYVQTTPAG
jgi:hypothetical protein